MGNRREPYLDESVAGCGMRPDARARPLFSFCVDLARDEGGQAILEYLLILMASVVGAGLISRKILETVDSGILKLGGQLEKDLKTGRLPLDIWKN